MFWMIFHLKHGDVFCYQSELSSKKQPVVSDPRTGASSHKVSFIARWSRVRISLNATKLSLHRPIANWGNFSHHKPTLWIFVFVRTRLSLWGRKIVAATFPPSFRVLTQSLFCQAPQIQWLTFKGRTVSRPQDLGQFKGLMAERENKVRIKGRIWKGEGGVALLHEIGTRNLKKTCFIWDNLHIFVFLLKHKCVFLER